MEEISLRFVIMITICAFCLQLQIESVRSQCLEDQQALLLQFKKTLIFLPLLTPKLVSWNSSSDCCGWGGVRCSTGGHVTDLDLSNEYMTGGFDNASSLFNLQHLQSLNLANNSFNSSIPSGFRKLSNLRYLNLGGGFVGNGFIGQVPLEISELTSLVTLDLSSQFYLGGSMKLENPNLAKLVQNLNELKHLYLDGVNISTEGKDWCQALSNSLPKLEELSMSNCYLSGPIDSSISKLQSLSLIRLDNNNLSGSVPEFLADLSNLTWLQLDWTNLRGKFPEKIFHVSTLKKLILSNNPSLEGSLNEFAPASSLELLLLSHTSFGGSLPQSIGDLGRLSSVELASCNFNGSIPDATGKLTQLISLDLSLNNFSGPIPSFSSVKNLTRLNLAHNRLSGSILSTDWSALSKLESIDLSNNSLNGTLPAALFGIPTLQKMRLPKNQFTGELRKPADSTSLLLDTLDLSGNKLAGRFPPFVFEFRNLSTLVLSSNTFSGPVNLSSFQQMKSLSSLDLSHNSLSIDTTGTDPTLLPRIRLLGLASCKLPKFPDFVKEISELGFLDLSNNQIGGEIPNWMWRFEYLYYLNLSNNFLVNLQEPVEALNSSLLYALDLSGNKLQGRLPMLPLSAGHLDYSSNNFSSAIPVNIGDMLKITSFFSLSNNNFHGSIPQSICNSSSLTVINLSNNSLSGAIPQCLTEMESLGVLKLKGNKLGGNISDTFSRNCTVQTIDFSGNQLEGKIPRSLANCISLEVLDLGNNQTRDVFPSHLKNISRLRVMVIRSNNLHGPINCVDDNSWPMLQIADLASNHFSGELPVQCLKNWKAMIVEKEELQHIQFDSPYKLFFSYQDTIVVTMKGLELQLVKILTIFTSIDFSCNNFEGEIPEMIGDLRALYILNLSHNSFTGRIPPTLGNLRNVESLDLSSNSFSGEIPQQLAGLNFLAVLNLSHNHLEGRIPSGNQFQTFSEDSFRDNEGLCGVPLKKSCSPNGLPPRSPTDYHSDKGIYVDWNFLSIELGFVFGLGIFILPLMLWRRWRIWYCIRLDVLLSRLVPQLNRTNRNRGGRTSRRTRTSTQLMERNKMAGDVALQPRVSTSQAGKRTGRVVVV